MKQLLMAAILTFAAFISNAQETTFKPFKVDLALGYAIPGGSGTKGGVIVALEPKYSINDNLTLGLRMELAVMVRLQKDASGNFVESEGDVTGSGTYLATADYFFNTNNFRPFVGAGVGVFSNASVDLASGSDEPQTSTAFGFAPRAGFELGKFRTAIEYNVAGKSGGISNNYLGIKLGFFFGGGRL